MGMKFIVSQTPEPPTGQWYTVLDNTYWSVALPGTTWTGSSWQNLSFASVSLNELGSWVEGYEPTKLRVTGTGGGTLQLILADGSSNIVQENPYTSGAEIDIVGQVSDIVTIAFSCDTAPVEVTNIEFFSVTDPT